MMNIFVLDNDPHIAAEMLCDKHSIKMILESTQMLTTAARLCGATDEDIPLTKRGTPYRSTHQNHPCTIWARETRSNFDWLVSHSISMLAEYTKRYGKTHACSDAIHQLATLRHLIPDGDLTPFAQAMPDHYRQSDAVKAYRAYYIGDKAYMATWKTEAPHWWVIE